MSWIAALFALAPQSPSAAPAQAVEAPLVEVRAAHMVDVRSGKLLDDVRVTLRGKSIVRVSSGTANGPAVTNVIDLGELTLVPGLIDCHVHLTHSLDGDFVNRPVHETLGDAVLHGVHNAKLTLAAGFTTVRNVGSDDFADISLMHAVERGDIDGPWIFPAGHAIGITGGHGDETGFRPGILEKDELHGIADGPEACRKAVREQIKYGAKVIKCIATAGVLSFETSVGAQQLSDEELRAIVDEASRHHVKVCAHAHGTEGILAAVKAGVASIEHGSMLDDACIEEMLKRGTYLVPTAYLRRRIDLAHLPEIQRQKAATVFPFADKSLRAAIQRGVKIAYGTDAGVYPHGENNREFAVLVEAGMKPVDALRSATLAAADLLGVTDRGEIAADKLADLVAVQGNPLADVKVLEHPKWVMHGGRVVIPLEK